MFAPALLFSDGLDPSTRSWVSAVYARGGSVSFPRRRIVDKFVRSEKSSGAWALTDDYWMLWGENAIQSLTSLKQRRLAVATNSPTFTADRGYTFDGSTNYIATGFIPSSHAVVMAGTSMRIAVYERTDVAANAYAAGINQGATQNLSIRPRTSGTNAIGNLNSGAATFTLPAADSRGFMAVSRAAGGTTMKGYKNGAAMTDVTGLTVGTSLPSIELFIGGANVAGSLNTPRACSIGMLSVGAPLSGAQELAQYNAIQAFATAVGVQV